VALGGQPERFARSTFDDGVALVVRMRSMEMADDLLVLAQQHGSVTGSGNRGLRPVVVGADGVVVLAGR